VGTTIWEHCNRCSGKKRHNIIIHQKFSATEEISDDFNISFTDEYDLLKCCGCDSVQLRHKSLNSEDYDHQTGQHFVTTRYYPPPSFRKPPKWLSDLTFVCDFDSSIEDLIREIYIALQNDGPRLAVMGIRALLETVMIDKVTDQGTFAKNLSAFEKEGFISPKQRSVLEPVLEAGHATMHRSYKPKKKEVALLMDITENIIETIYVNEYRARGLTNKFPPRKKQTYP